MQCHVGINNEIITDENNKFLSQCIGESKMHNYSYPLTHGVDNSLWLSLNSIHKHRGGKKYTIFTQKPADCDYCVHHKQL